jgi:PIN domain nuclease of toxin-antitoxin system
LIVLDTHVWVWWNSSPEKLSTRARQLIRDAEEVGVSAISPWEVSMLVAKGRLRLDRDVLVWVEEALKEVGISLLAISPRIAVTAGSLEGLHGDPADRLIVATAMETSSVLVSKDSGIRSFAGVNAVW